MIECSIKGEKRKGEKNPAALNLKETGDFLVVQWLKLCAPNSGGTGSIPGWGTRSHMLQLRPCAAKKKKKKEIKIKETVYCL